MAVYLAFDYGLQRIGIAVGESSLGTARPLPALQNDGGLPKHLKALLKEWEPAALIVGLPLGEDGSEQTMSQQARAFADSLQQSSQKPVHLADERFSSKSADDVLRGLRASGQRPRRLQKGDRDGMSATIILQQWFSTLS
jgi:putative Holliday junction resolvase